MKTLQKIFLPFILIASVAITSSFKGTSTKAPPVTLAGIYVTYQDFQAKKLTEWDEIKFGHGAFKGAPRGGKKLTSSYKDSPYWGGQTDEGTVYRFNKKSNIAVQIITNSKICFYAGMELTVNKYDNGTLAGIDIHADKGTKFSEVFWFSSGGEGDFIPASQDNLTKLLADNADLVAKVNAKGIEEKNVDKWFENITNICGWIKEYIKTAK